MKKNTVVLCIGVALTASLLYEGTHSFFASLALKRKEETLLTDIAAIRRSRHAFLTAFEEFRTFPTITSAEDAQRASFVYLANTFHRLPELPQKRGQRALNRYEADAQQLLETFCYVQGHESFIKGYESCVESRIRIAQKLSKEGRKW